MYLGTCFVQMFTLAKLHATICVQAHLTLLCFAFLHFADISPNGDMGAAAGSLAISREMKPTPSTTAPLLAKEVELAMARARFFASCPCSQGPWLNGLQYSINITFICTGKQRNKQKSVAHFIGIFALLQWSGTEPAVSLWYACILYYFITV